MGIYISDMKDSMGVSSQDVRVAGSTKWRLPLFVNEGNQDYRG